MRVEIKVEGMDTINEILDGIPEQIIPLAAVGLARGLDMIAEDARMHVPVRTHDLQKSIKPIGPEINGNSVSGSVIADKEYAVYVEMGTGQRGAANSPEGALAVGATYSAGHAGMEAQPYMYPAYKANEKAVIQSVADSLREGMSG